MGVGRWVEITIQEHLVKTEIEPFKVMTTSTHKKKSEDQNKEFIRIRGRKKIIHHQMVFREDKWLNQIQDRLRKKEFLGRRW